MEFEPEIADIEFSTNLFDTINKDDILKEVKKQRVDFNIPEKVVRLRDRPHYKDNMCTYSLNGVYVLSTSVSDPKLFLSKFSEDLLEYFRKYSSYIIEQYELKNKK